MSDVWCSFFPHKHVSGATTVVINTKDEGPQLPLVKGSAGTELESRECLVKVPGVNHYIVIYTFHDLIWHFLALFYHDVVKLHHLLCSRPPISI